MSAEQSNQPNPPNQSFVRPEVNLTLDTPLSDMRVRDLFVILSGHLANTSSGSEVFIKHKVPRDLTPDLNPSPARPEGTGGLQDLIQAVTTLKDHTIKLSAQVSALQQKNQ
jgi:hypothetical protein